MKKSHVFQKKLLDWYDRHRRILPWRAEPHQTADPYHVWLSEIMLQQTTVPAVKSYFEKFLILWPSVKDLAAADPEEVMHEWAGLGYYARARNLLKCAQVIANEYDGQFPRTEKELLSLPGIGPYTAAAISAIAFDREAIVVDGNVERIASRLFRIEAPLPKGKKEIARQAEGLYEGIGKEKGRAADFPQALMDLGSMVCTPKSPKCGICPVSEFCEGQKRGDAESYPLREKKIAKPSRTGQVYWITTPKGILVERRPENRMLGGMIGFPTTDWDSKDPQNRQNTPVPSEWVEKGEKMGEIRHVFTHFALQLDIIQIDGEKLSIPLKENQYFMAQNDIIKAGFPSLFKKLVRFMMDGDNTFKA